MHLHLAMQHAIKRTEGKWNVLFLLLIVLELCFLLYFNHDIIPHYWNGILLFACSLSIGILVIVRYWAKTEATNNDAAVRPKWNRYLPLVLFGCLVIPLVFRMSSLFNEVPILPKYSDIIPTIKVLVSRLLNGQTVYKPIDDFGYHMPVTYLPLQWAPYVIAEWLHFDYRWIAFCIWLIACVALIITNRQRRLSSKITIPVVLALVVTLLIKYEPDVLTMSVELMVAGYYILFIIGISSNNPWIKGLVITLCLLSRYSLILWLPLWMLAEWIAHNRMNTLKSIVVIASAIFLLYVLPFLRKDWSTLLAGYHYYTNAAIGEWEKNNWYGKPQSLYCGVGFARFFYEGTGPLVLRLKRLQQVHFILCLASVFVMAIFHMLFSKKLPLKPFLLASFKIYLSFFLAFIQVPYIYLMITGSFVSIAIYGVMQNLSIGGPESVKDYSQPFRPAAL